jgi:hypothetical protein
MYSSTSATQESESRHHRSCECSVFARSGSEFECLRGFRSTDTLFTEAIQSFTARLLADDWCHEVRCSSTQRPSKHNSAEAEGNSINF